jgi:uncharacterized protein YcgL (UPF0745 family)
MYLFVERSEGLERVPAVLLQAFGKPESAMLLMLDAGRSLAAADAVAVLAAISEQGFYLQMPPTPGGNTGAAIDTGDDAMHSDPAALAHTMAADTIGDPSC